MAKISIVVPVYNVEKYLTECLDSIQNQSLKDIEIICVDDGSTDLSGHILDKYAAEDERFRIVHKQNEGYGKSINVGMKMATAPYIGIVESDDMIIPDMYKVLYEIMEDKHVDVIKADFYEFYESEEGEYIEHYVPLTANEKLKELYGNVINVNEHENVFLFNKHTWTGLYDRAFLEYEHIMHNETPGASYQDTGFWFQTLVKARSIYFEKQAFYRYRIDNENSSMYSKSKAFTLFEEYNFIYDVLNQMGDKGKKFYKWANYIKITDCINSISRVADSLRIPLVQVIKEKFLEDAAKGEVDATIYAEGWKMKIFDIISNPVLYVEKESRKRQKIESAVKGYNKIIIYGAGRIGRMVQGALQEGRLHTKIKSFAVSELERETEISGVPVRRIDELTNYKDEALVIISSGKTYAGIMEENLKKLKFQHYVMYKDVLG